MQGTLLSVQVGTPQDHVTPEGFAGAGEQTWRSGIVKTPVAGPVRVTPQGIAGDGQDDLKHHGGPDNVALMYAAAHYAHWRQVLERTDLAFGSFGENLTVDGLTDQTVCLGDVFEVGRGPGALRLQISQPRQPCSKLARRLARPDIVKLVMDAGWGGWYLRLLQEGVVEVGMRVTLVARPHADWPVTRAVRVMYERKTRPAEAAELAALPELSRRWRREVLV